MALIYIKKIKREELMSMKKENAKKRMKWLKKKKLVKILRQMISKK